LRRDPIIGSSMKKRFIHLDLMVWKNARGPLGTIASLKLVPSFLIQVETLK